MRNAPATYLAVAFPLLRMLADCSSVAVWSSGFVRLMADRSALLRSSVSTFLPMCGYVCARRLPSLPNSCRKT